MLLHKFVEVFDTLKIAVHCFWTRDTLKKVIRQSLSYALFLLLCHFHMNLNIQNSWPHWSSTYRWQFSTSNHFHVKWSTNPRVTSILPTASISLCALRGHTHANTTEAARLTAVSILSVTGSGVLCSLQAYYNETINSTTSWCPLTKPLTASGTGFSMFSFSPWHPSMKPLKVPLSGHFFPCLGNFSAKVRHSQQHNARDSDGSEHSWDRQQDPPEPATAACSFLPSLHLSSCQGWLGLTLFLNTIPTCQWACHCTVTC